MKKLIFFIVLLISFNSIFAQIRTVNLIDKKIGQTHFTYSKIDDLEKNTTLYNVSLVFQNEKYSKISDIRIVSIYKKQDLDLFTKDLQKCFKFMFDKVQGDLSFNRSNYRLTLHNFTSDLLLSDIHPGLTSGGTYLQKIDVVELLETISTIQFGTIMLSSPKSFQEQIK